VSLAGLPVAAPVVWKVRRQYHVAWIEDCTPTDEESDAVREAVVDRRLSTYGQVTLHVADRLFRQDQQHAGWISDIGLFHSWYLLHACQVLERLDGIQVRIDEG
jgi:lauroyl/myristoyl acyltransferase